MTASTDPSAISSNSNPSAPPLDGKVALVTGVSQRIGIGAAIARRLIDDGARVFATGWPAHDAEMPWGEEAEGGFRRYSS